LAVVCTFGLFRAFRFVGVEDVIRSRSQSPWRLWTVFALLGPCESVVPVLVKARAMGQGYPLAIVCFLLGTLMMGGVLVWAGRSVWNRPALLTRWVAVLRRGRGRTLPIPVAGAVAIGIICLLKLG
jgi:hypothetical protein